jgi:hypothetical protein
VEKLFKPCTVVPVWPRSIPSASTSPALSATGAPALRGAHVAANRHPRAIPMWVPVFMPSHVTPMVTVVHALYYGICKV